MKLKAIALHIDGLDIIKMLSYDLWVRRVKIAVYTGVLLSALLIPGSTLIIHTFKVRISEAVRIVNLVRGLGNSTSTDSTIPITDTEMDTGTTVYIDKYMYI